MSLFRRSDRHEADATVSRVEMLKRVNYGTASVRITYQVRPLDRPPFEVVRDVKVKMQTLPQAGQEVRVSFDPAKPQKLEVLTPPGEEGGTVTTPTVEIPYRDSAHPLTDQVTRVEARVRSLEHQEGPGSKLDELKQLGELRDSGVLTEAEFESEKARILAE